MPTRLESILATTRATVAEAKNRVSVAELDARAAKHQPRGFAAMLRAVAMERPAVIAELKKASPSKGLIRADFQIEWLAQRYAIGGAGALSVLTDEPYFQGSLRNLELTSATVPLPCLRKDFTVDEYQILEARAHCADAILLIVAGLTDEELLRFTRSAHALELDVLAEVHTADELDRLLAIGEAPDLIGVNNRDLHTFEVRLETSLTLIERIPASVLRVTESGITSSSDISCLRQAGYDCFLVGESLMRQPDPAIALQELIGPVSTAVR